jgi:arylsulfatase A-like enzyme
MRSIQKSSRFAPKIPIAYYIACTSAVAWFFLAIFRTYIVTPDMAAQPLASAVLNALGASYNDLLFVLAIAVAFVLAVSVTGRHRRVAIFLWVVFAVVIATTVAWGFANMKLTHVLGEPFTYQWLLYADFLENSDATAAMKDAANNRDATLLAGSVLAVLIIGHSLGWLAFRLLRGVHIGILTPAVGVVLAAVVLVTRNDAAAMQLPAAKIENPIIYFVSSVLQDTHPVLFTMHPKTGDQDFGTAGEHKPTTSNFPRSADHPIKNVLIFVFESTPWEYVEPFGGKYPITPNLAKYAASAQLFTNMYAHAPATNYSLFSLFTSLYPDISYNSISASHPTVPFKTIASELSSKGFRTAFFWSADLRFQSFDQFIRGKGFDVVKDFRSMGCDRPIFKLSTEKWKYMDHAHDVCTARAFGEWISDKSDKPYLGVMMTAMTHYPYVTNPEKVHYVDDEKQNDYLNALKIGDQAFGIVMDKLAASGKLDSTLVVVLGDHGEAFGQHGTYVHASGLYEENVHIPFMLINNQLFHGGKSSTLGGVIDVAPTVLDMLGVNEPDEWQGRSLFSMMRPERIFFFSPWNGYLFGYRQENLKVLYNASTNKTELYDLSRDPRERQNLLSKTDEVNDRLDPIASWVQFQRKLIAQAVATAEPPKRRCILNELSFDAAGTIFKGAPKLDIRIDGKPVGTVEVTAGLQSKASTADKIREEMELASGRTAPFKVSFPNMPDAKNIELRFTNDLWGADPNGGDRNVFVTNVAVNGEYVPIDRYWLAEKDIGIVSQNGAALYRNGSLVILGPFTNGC